LMSVKDFKVLL